MKKFGLLLVVVALFILSPASTSAQFRLSLNIGSQPEWGPASYDHVEYYYLPEIGIYYYVPRSQFVYRSGSRWIFSRTLPSRYRNFDLYSTYKVVVNEPRPYLRHDYYVSNYEKFRNARGQQKVIRDVRGHGQQMDRNAQDNSRNRMYMAPQNRNDQQKGNNGKHKGQEKHNNQGNNNDRNDDHR